VTFAARLKRCPDGERQAEARRYVCFASRGSVADCAWADDRCVVKSRKLSSGAEAHLFAVVAWGPSLSLDKLKSPPPKEFKRQAEARRYVCSASRTSEEKSGSLGCARDDNWEVGKLNVGPEGPTT